MRILTIHADFIEFQPLQKAIENPEKAELTKTKFEDCLVVFAAVERGDEVDLNQIALRTADEIEDVAYQVMAKRIVIYPWVHLTSNPASPSFALSALKEIERILIGKKEYEVHSSPFGYYKEFTIKCKGHPLSELSREIRIGEESKTLMKREKPPGETKPPEKLEVSESLKLEEKTKSRFYILTPEGELVENEKFDYKAHPMLKKFVDYEIKKVRAYDREPPHIKLMKEHGIADYEPGSDLGNFRWPPKGRLIKKLLEKRITDYCVDYGAIEVETPIMYDSQHPALKKYLNRFPARQYIVKSDEKEFFLRFAACFGQFLISHDMLITYKNLPFKIFELTKYSFRREQSGELVGLKRVRALTMPDLHTFCKDLEQSKDEFEKQFYLSYDWMKDLGFEFETAFRVQDDFYNENKEFYIKLVKKLGKPVLIELFDIRYAYFITKFEFNFVDNLDKASALSTVQIDVENAETFDLNYVDADGKKKRPIILHASISGSLERVVYALLEKEARRISEKKTPMLPIWLSPTQVRIISITNKQMEFAKEVFNQLELENVRCDIDERDETLGGKIRDAEKDWVPYIIVIGDREVESKKLSIRMRETNENKQLALEEILVMLRSKVKGKPYEKLSLSPYLTKRPII